MTVLKSSDLIDALTKISDALDKSNKLTSELIEIMRDNNTKIIKQIPLASVNNNNHILQNHNHKNDNIQVAKSINNNNNNIIDISKVKDIFNKKKSSILSQNDALSPGQWETGNQPDMDNLITVGSGNDGALNMPAWTGEVVDQTL